MSAHRRDPEPPEPTTEAFTALQTAPNSAQRTKNGPVCEPPKPKPRRHHGHCRYVRHPKFPHMPASVPLTYTLTMKACLSTSPQDRPSFTAVLTLLDYMATEVASGRYINTRGHWQVRWPLLCLSAFVT
jgi:hypothetical protein